MKVLMFEVGAELYITEIENEQDVITQIFGGYHTEVSLDDEVPAMLVCNEEGTALKLQKNRALIIDTPNGPIYNTLYGNYFVC